MTVKEQVKEIIHEIKHHFSHHKHHRDESSTSSHTLVSDDSSHTAHSGGHSRPGTPEGGELSSHLGTPEHGDFVPTTPERKRVLSVSSHKHNVFLKLRRRKSSNLSVDPRSKTPEREVFPNGSQPGTPEHSVTSSNPGTPESSSFNHGSARQRVPSTPTRKPNVLHKFRRGSSHFKSSSEPHAPEKGEIPVIHHHSSMSKLREHLGSHAPETTELPAIHHHSSLSKLRDGQDVFQSDAEADREVAETATAKDGESTHGPLPIIITSPPMEEKTESYGGTLHPSMYEGGVDIIDRPSVQLECEPVPEAEEEVAGEDTGSFVGVDRVQTQTNLDTEQNQTDLDMEPAETNVNVGQTQADSDTVQTQMDLDVGQTQADLDVGQTRTDLDVEQTRADSDIEQGLTDLDGEQTRTDLNVGQTQADSDTVQTQTDLKVEETQADSDIEQGQTDLEVEHTQADSDIEQSQTDLVVEQTQVDSDIEQSQSDLVVEQTRSDLNVEQGQVDLDVEQGQADLDVEQTRTELDVEQAQTDLAVEQMQTELGVEQGQADLNIGQAQAEAETQTSAEPASEGPVVAPISQQVCDSSSASDPVAIIDSALNPDGNDRKSVEVPHADPVTVDPPVLAVIDGDQDIATEEVKEPIESEMFATKDDYEAEVQGQSTVDTSLSEETTLAQSVPSLPEPVNPHVSSTHPTPPASTSVPSSSPYLPRLTAPTMFLPIPNTDPLSPLLTKHVPPEQRPRRDVTGEWTGREMHEMVMSNSWRALARMARDLIVASDPEDLSRILDLWSLRLSALARLRLTNQASAECTNLFAVLNAIPPAASTASLASGAVALHSATVSATPKSPAATLRPQSPAAVMQQAGSSLSAPSTPTQRLSPLPGVAHAQPQSQTQALATRLSALSAYPFELSVLRARVHYWAGDVRGYIDALAGLLAGCKAKARAEGKIVRDLMGTKTPKQKEEGKSKEAVEPGADRDNQKEGCEDEDGDGDDDDDDDDDDENEDTETDDQSEEGEDSEKENNQEGDEEQRSDEQHKAEAEDNADADEEDESDGALATAEANFSMWLERSARVCLMIASQLVEMKDYHAAITLLTPLCTQQLSPGTGAAPTPVPSPAIHSAVARIYLLSGNIPKAAEHFRIVASCADAEPGTVAMNTALLCFASGDWPRAEAALREVLEQDPRNYTAMNNLAVTLLAQGRVRDGIGLLESAMHASPASVLSAEPFIFNLSTLYELRSSTAVDKKRELLVEVARWSGDGLRATCLKMPST